MEISVTINRTVAVLAAALIVGVGTTAASCHSSGNTPQTSGQNDINNFAPRLRHVLRAGFLAVIAPILALRVLFELLCGCLWVRSACRCLPW